MENIQTIYSLRPITPSNTVANAGEYIEKNYGKTPLFVDFKSLPTITLRRCLNTMIGIEVEVENFQGNDGLKNRHWGVVADHSLRNGGVEFVSHVGNRVHDLLPSVKTLFEWCQAMKIRTSDRTSIHVHVNVRDLSMEELNSFLILYTVFENSLFEFAGIWRYSNVFCVPLSETSVGEGGRRTLEEKLNSSEKYTALNTLAVKEKGTLEFRHMECHFDYLRMTIWLMFIVLMKSFIRSHSLREVKEFIMALGESKQYGEFSEEVFHGFGRHLTINPKKMNRLISTSKCFFFEDD